MQAVSDRNQQHLKNAYEIRLNGDIDIRRGLVIFTGAILAITFLAFLTIEPDPDLTWEEHMLNLSPVGVLVVLFYVTAVPQKTTIVDCEGGQINLVRSVLGVPYLRRTIPIDRLTGITIVQPTEDSFNQFLQLYIRCDGNRIVIARRFYSDGYLELTNFANNLGVSTGNRVETVIQK